MTYVPKTAPWGPFQQAQFDEYHERIAHAYLNQQGLGKTWQLINDLGCAFLEKKITGALVVAPNGVHTNWVLKEIPKHLHDDIKRVVLEYHSSTSGTKTALEARKKFMSTPEGTLPILCMSYNAFMTDRGKSFAKAFLAKFDVFYILDESHFIKTPDAARTKTIVASGTHATMRRISTGTIMGAKNSLDLYSQIKFLDEHFWKRYLDIKNFGLFKSYFADWVHMEAGWPKIVRYKNQDELRELIKKISCRVLKQDVLKDLPPKIHKRMYFDLPGEHRRVYKQMKQELRAQLLSGEEVEVMSALVGMGKLCQIACGYVKDTETGENHPIDDNFPRIDRALEWCAESETQGIIWCRHTKDIDMLCSSLGSLAARLDGSVSKPDRVLNIERFERGEARFMVTIPSVGGTGYTWNQADRVLFHAVGMNLIELEQAQDRNHRIGQYSSVTYTYLVARRTIDEKIIDTHLSNREIQAEILGDNLLAWLEESE